MPNEARGRIGTANSHKMKFCEQKIVCQKKKKVSVKIKKVSPTKKCFLKFPQKFATGVCAANGEPGKCLSIINIYHTLSLWNSTVNPNHHMMVSCWLVKGKQFLKKTQLLKNLFFFLKKYHMINTIASLTAYYDL